MNIIVYDNAKNFLNDFEEILLKEEEANQLILSNLYLYQNGFERNNIFGCVYEDNLPILLFLNAFPFNLQIYTFDKNLEAYELLIKYINNNDIEFNGVNGSYDDTKLFIELYEQKGYGKFKLFLATDIMRLDKLIDVKLAKGSFMLAKDEDIEDIQDCLVAFTKEALHQDNIDLEKIRSSIRKKIDLGKQFVFKNEDNIIVSIVNNGFRELKHGIVITGVYTKPNFRGMGYCQTMIWHLCNINLKSGYHYITLFVDKMNPISNRVYEKVGFKIVKNNYAYNLKK